MKKYVFQIILPEYNEIPDVGLYLDQVVKYVNSYLTGQPEMQVTASMVTNYIKHKIVRRINKKTYTRDQIAQFFFISLSKAILSLDQIALIIKDRSEPDFAAFYTSFRNRLKDNKKTEDELLFLLVGAMTAKFRISELLSD